VEGPKQKRFSERVAKLVVRGVANNQGRGGAGWHRNCDPFASGFRHLLGGKAEGETMFNRKGGNPKQVKGGEGG